MNLVRQNENGASFLQCGDSIALEIPGCIMYSRGGTIPHLTSDNVSTIPQAGNVWQVPLETIFEQPGLEVMKKFGKSFHKFSCTEDKFLLLNPNDSYLDKSDIYKYNEEKSISIWAPGGRRKIIPEDYMKFLETFGFDVCIPPSDQIPENMSKKRCRKSFERTIRFLDECLRIKEQKKLTIPVLGVIEGGDSKYEREKCAKEVKQRNVDAYLLSGFDRIISNRKELLEITMNQLEKEKVKFMFGILTPVEVIDAVEVGVDVFDNVIAFYASERGCALNFPFTGDEKRHDENGLSCDNDVPDNGKSQKDISAYEINLNSKKYFDDVRSIVDQCRCYCCSRYNRAYLHHLLVTKEMLAQVLLMMHNLTHWLEFFKEIRGRHKSNRLNNLRCLLNKSS